MYDDNPDEGPQPSDDLALSLGEVTALIQAGSWFKDHAPAFHRYKFREDLLSALEKLMAEKLKIDKAWREETPTSTLYPERYDEVG